MAGLNTRVDPWSCLLHGIPLPFFRGEELIIPGAKSLPRLVNMHWFPERQKSWEAVASTRQSTIRSRAVLRFIM